MEKLVTALAAAALAAHGGDAPPTPFLSDPDVFRCSPAVVAPGDTIVLSKRSAALRELAVLRPGNPLAHFLVVELPPEGMTPLMSAEDLGAATQFSVRSSELIGMEWSVDASPEPVFTVSGTYEFWLSTNLESEEGAYVCRVEYRASGAGRPPGSRT